MPILCKIIASLAFVCIDKIIFSCNRKSGFLLAITLIFRTKVEFYNNVFDNDVKTLEDFSHKYIGIN